MNGNNEYTFGTLQFEQSEEEIVREEKRRQFKTRCLVIWTSITIACIILIVIVLSVLFSVNSNRGTSKITTSSRVLDGNVTVYYAASLQDVMTRLINPEFTSLYNTGVIGVPGPSGALATALKTGIAADVFISADSAISASLLPILLPSSKTTILSWYTLWADTQLGIGYNVNSKFKDTFEAIANGSLPWYVGLDQTTMKIGRTDPDLDPKGYRTVIMSRLAEIYYNTSGIEKKVLGTARNNLQLFSETNLESLLTSGSIDVGFFYKIEKTWIGNLKFIKLPTQLAMNNISLNSYYKKANYTNSVTKKVSFGSAIVYALSIPNSAKNKEKALVYVQNLISRNNELSAELSQLLKTVPEPNKFIGNISGYDCLKVENC